MAAGSGTNVTVVIGMMMYNQAIFMYKPAVDTIVEGLTRLGARVLVGAGARSVAAKAKGLVRGDALIFVGMKGKDVLKCSRVMPSACKTSVSHWAG